MMNFFARREDFLIIKFIFQLIINFIMVAFGFSCNDCAMELIEMWHLSGNGADMQHIRFVRWIDFHSLALTRLLDHLPAPACPVKLLVVLDECGCREIAVGGIVRMRSDHGRVSVQEAIG